MVEQLMIARLGSRGDGIADTAAGTIYVPYALPGETAEVEPWPGHADRRQLIKIDVASPDRIAPICPHFGICGGCALQHLATARYRDWKRALVVAALARAGLDAPIDDLIDAHGEGRRRAVFHARVSARDVIEVGFSALKAHHVVAIDRCPILAPGLAGAIEAAWAIAEALAATPGAAGGGTLRGCQYSGRPVLRGRAFRAAPCRARPRHRGGQQRGCDRGLTACRGGNARAQAGRNAGA
jgi:23S rRNA (uracil1939-C5)-methyltransferase